MSIEVTNISKQYRKSQGSYKTLREDVYRLFGRDKAKEDGGRAWALHDISLSVQQGETLGVIGVNGSGKTTLLRLLAGVTKPTLGEIKIEGRIGTLIEITSGFELELTGRENVLLNGSLLGMSNREVREKFDDIVEFSGIGREWIDVPYKRYSSGMMVRLGFAVAINIEPEVLLVDEVLSVGDAAFQEKCHEKIRGLLDRGCATVLVSHNMNVVKKNCHRVVWLDRGEVVEEGDAEDVVGRYLKPKEAK